MAPADPERAGAAGYLRTVAFTSTITLRSLTGSAAWEIDQRLAALQDHRQALVHAGRARCRAVLVGARRAVNQRQLELNRAVDRDQRTSIDVQIHHERRPPEGGRTLPTERILPQLPLETIIDTVFFSGVSVPS